MSHQKALWERIQARINKRGRGKVYTSKDFLDLGDRDAVDQALSRLAAQGRVKRIGRGLYHYPRCNKRLGLELGPDLDEIARAVARQTGSRVVPSGAVAANWLGLSTQVPAKPVYLTDARTRQVRVGNTVIHVKHVAPKDLPLGSPTSAMVFQALKHLGKEAVGEETIRQLRDRLTRLEKARLRKDAHHVTDWIGEVIRRITSEASSDRDVEHG